MLNIRTDAGAYDPSTKHAFFEEEGRMFEVRFAMGAGYPGSVKLLSPYRHLGMTDWDNEEQAREIARNFLASHVI